MGITPHLVSPPAASFIGPIPQRPPTAYSPRATSVCSSEPLSMLFPWLVSRPALLAQPEAGGRHRRVCPGEQLGDPVLPLLSGPHSSPAPLLSGMYLLFFQAAVILRLLPTPFINSMMSPLLLCYLPWYFLSSFFALGPPLFTLRSSVPGPWLWPHTPDSTSLQWWRVPIHLHSLAESRAAGGRGPVADPGCICPLGGAGRKCPSLLARIKEDQGFPASLPPALGSPIQPCP